MNYDLLSKITSPVDVKKFNNLELNQLCAEIRDCLIKTVSKNGGHLASNLGTVELTVALHRSFNSPDDSILFDVGHQSYTHKILTGRFDRFDTIRTENGISGFMRPEESEHDPFVTGHSSNSLSASLGIYKAKQLNHQCGYVISIVGDGAMTGGMVYEALNNAGSGRSNFIVVLNDNKMSISRNVGGFARYLTYIRSKAGYHRLKNRINSFLHAIPFIGNRLSFMLFNSKTMLKNAIYKSNIFEGMGFNYLGPVDGHNINALENIFKIAKTENRPTVVHILTTKGKGYSFAENDPKNYHGVSAFDIEEGASQSSSQTYSDVFGETLTEMAESNPNICAITAAMTSGTGLAVFSKKFKNRFFDVGIAEEHAMTFSAGLGIKGMLPYFAVYSSFLQRSYDQIIHDVAIAGIPVKICVDRAGVVGEDGESHQGLFDAAFLSTVPGMQVFSPCYYSELVEILHRSEGFDFPCAIRYPRGQEIANPDFVVSQNNYDIFGAGNIALVTYGRIFSYALEAQQRLSEQGIDIAIVKLNRIYPLDKELCNELNTFSKIFFFEEGIRCGGIGEHLGTMLYEGGVSAKYKLIAVENKFVGAAKTINSLKSLGLDAEGMINAIKGDI